MRIFGDSRHTGRARRAYCTAYFTRVLHLTGRRWLTHQSRRRRCLLLCACRASYEVVLVMQRLSRIGHSNLALPAN